MNTKVKFNWFKYESRNRANALPFKHSFFDFTSFPIHLINNYESQNSSKLNFIRIRAFLLQSYYDTSLFQTTHQSNTTVITQSQNGLSISPQVLLYHSPSYSIPTTSPHQTGNLKNSLSKLPTIKIPTLKTLPIENPHRYNNSTAVKVNTLIRAQPTLWKMSIGKQYCSRPQEP